MNYFAKFQRMFAKKCFIYLWREAYPPDPSLKGREKGKPTPSPSLKGRE